MTGRVLPTKSNTILGIKTAKYWDKSNWQDIPEDPTLDCMNCNKMGAQKLALVTFAPNMHWQVGTDPVGLIRDDYFSQLCKKCRSELIIELKKAGDFYLGD